MSSIQINGDTSGSVSLVAPSVAGTTTLTLPATSGTILQSGTTVTEAQGGTGTTIGYYGFKNRIINGAMVIDQRYAGVATSSSIDGYTLDRWQVECNGVTGKLIAQQNAGSVTPATGFKNYLGVTSQSAYTVGSTDRFVIDQFIEGLNVYDLAWGTANASTVTLSFWVRSSLTGTFGGSLSNSAANRSYPFSYTISSANTWEQKTLTIAGDTSGTWLTTNGIGIRLYFGLGVGSTYSGTAGAWAGSFYQSATGATSVVGTNGATFYITGVQLEKGSTATSFDYRPYGTELQLCQRYYYKTKAAGTDSFFGTGYNESTVWQQTLTIFPVTMRTPPSALEQSGTAGDYRISHVSSLTTCNSVPTFNFADVFSARTQFGVASGLTAGQGSMSRSVNSNAYLAWSAEL